MRRCFVVVAAVLALAGSPAPSAAAGDPRAPARLRLSLGPSGTLLTVGWYVGVWRALEEGSFEFGVRLSFSRAPRRRREKPRPPSPGLAFLEEALRARAPRTAAVDAITGAVVAYGMLPGVGSVGRFLAEGDLP